MNIEQLKQHLKINDETGEIERINISKYANGNVEKVVSPYMHHSGYMTFKVARKMVRYHTVKWMLSNDMNVPDGHVVDHEDNDRTNNKIGNLRLAKNSENAFNRKISTRNTTGIKGVGICNRTGLFKVRVAAYGKQHYVGIFENIDDARMAAEAKREDLHGKFANHG